MEFFQYFSQNKLKNISFLSYRPRHAKIVFVFGSWVPNTPNDRDLILEIQESMQGFISEFQDSLSLVQGLFTI